MISEYTFLQRFLSLLIVLALVLSMVAVDTFAATGTDRYTTLLVHANGADASTSFTDVSFPGRTITTAGNAQVDTGQSKFGGASLLLDGSGDYLGLAANDLYDLGPAGGADFTIDFWVRFNTESVSAMRMLDAGNNNGWLLYMSGNTTISLWTATGPTQTSWTWDPVASTWYHVALVRYNGVFKMFIDGTSLGDGTDRDMDNNGSVLNIGISYDGSAGALNGWMDEIRISKGVARWTANFTPPTGEYGPDGRVTTFLTSGTSWTVPSDWNSSRNTIEVIGGGGGGGGRTSGATAAMSGGGGGGYSRAVNVSLTPGGTVTYAVGSGGAGGQASTATSGGDTYFCNSTSNCASIAGSAVVAGAKGGTGAATGAAGAVGVGGASASGVGSVKYSGGDGSLGATNRNSGGGGGAAGPRGAGETATSTADGGRGGRGGAGYGGNGGILGTAGSTGNEWGFGFGSGGGGGTRNTDANTSGYAGGAYGGGGGGAYSTGNNLSGGSGAAGIIVITYYPSTAPGLTLNGGRFLSNLDIRGNFAKGSGTFAIDHPLRPGTHILYHSFVESPDVKNLYDGIAELDENGEATITLPNYFEALNKDFRYLYFPLEKAMPNLHIKKEIENNRFTIGGGVPYGEVSWQVTGTRHDPYILKNPIRVEVEKGPDALKDKGECLYEPACTQ